jgi:hypothetical protein
MEPESENDSVTEGLSCAATPVPRRLKPIDDSADFATDKQAALSTGKKTRKSVPRLMDCLMELVKMGIIGADSNFSSCSVSKET